jgi:uncharacterized protein YbjT (DUF2867 family)
MLAVMGVTGQVGGAVASRLLGLGMKVRAIVREPRKAAVWAERGCEIAVADVNDAEALDRAFSGTDGAFVMLPPIFDPAPGFPEARRAIANLRRSLSSATPGRVVVLSTIGAHQERQSLLYQLHLLEQELRTLPVPVLFLRPAWFMENTSWDLESAAARGVVASFLQPLDKTFPMIAAQDVGAVAAELLLEPWEGVRVVEIEGRDRVSPAQVGDTLTRLLNRRVRMEVVAREDWESAFRSAGMKNPEPRILMLDGFNDGWIEFEAGQEGSRKTKTSLAEPLGHLAERQPASGSTQ